MRLSAARRTALATILALVFAAALTTGTAASASVIGLPDVSASASDNRVTPAQQVAIDVYLTNDGAIQRGGPAQYEDRVTTARATRMTVRSGSAPVTVKTGERSVGTVPTGTAGPFPVTVAVDGDADPGVYRLPVEITYSYTRSVEYSGPDDTSPSYNDLTRTVTDHVEIVVEDRAYFSVVDATSDVEVGDTGTYELTLRNDGSQAASDARVTVSSDDPAVSVGNLTRGTTAFVGDWPTGATRTVSYRVAVAPDAVPRSYTVDARVLFDDASGVARQSRTLSAPLDPERRASVAVESVEADLSVGGRGTVRGTLRNRGPPLRDAVLRIGSDTAAIAPTEGATALGRLERNETVPFEYAVNVSTATEPGQRRLRFDVEYRNDVGDLRLAEPAFASVRVDAARDAFAVTARNATFEVDSSGTLAVDVRNDLDEPVTEVRATMSVSDPLESEDASSYVEQLAPGASARMPFDLEVTNDAVPKTHSVAVRIAYRDGDGVQRRTPAYTVPVEVVEPAVSAPVGPIAAVLIAAAIGLLWWRRRR